MRAWILAGLFGIGLTACGDSQNAAPTPAPASAPVAAVVPSPSPESSSPAAEAKPGSKWDYQQDEDKMRGATTYRAVLASDNFINQSFPYEGDVHLNLYLRKRADGDKDVILHIEKGQMPCFSSSEGCSFKAKFDNGPIQTFRAVGTSGAHDDAIFLDGNMKKFMSSLRKAKEVTIEVNLYETGRKQFTFTPGGLDWKWF